MRSVGVAAAHCQVLFPGHAHCQVLPPDLPCWLTNPQQSHTQRAGTGALSPMSGKAAVTATACTWGEGEQGQLGDHPPATEDTARGLSHRTPRGGPDTTASSALTDSQPTEPPSCHSHGPCPKDPRDLGKG